MTPFMLGVVTDSSEQTDFIPQPGKITPFPPITGPDSLALGFRLNYVQTDDCTFG